MNSIFRQDARMGRLSTALGKDSLVLQRFEGADYLSQLSEYQVDCLAITPDIDFDALIGTHATITLVTHDGEERPYGGIVTEARGLARVRAAIATGSP